MLSICTTSSRSRKPLYPCEGCEGFPELPVLFGTIINLQQPFTVKSPDLQGRTDCAVPHFTADAVNKQCGQWAIQQSSSSLIEKINGCMKAL